MTRSTASNRSRVVGYMPKGSETFELAEIRAMTLSADMPGFFEGSGLQVDFNADDISREGTFSLCLTLADAKALVAQMEARIGDVQGWAKAPR